MSGSKWDGALPCTVADFLQIVRKKSDVIERQRLSPGTARGQQLGAGSACRLEEAEDEGHGNDGHEAGNEGELSADGAILTDEFG